MPNENEAILIALLAQVKGVLDRHNITFWLDCGTLLGAVRNGKFIEWETDIDLGTWGNYVPKKKKRSVCEDLRKRGYSVNIYDTFLNISQKNVCADLKFYTLNGNKAMETKLHPKNLAGSFLRFFSHALLTPYKADIVLKETFIRNFILNTACISSRIIPSFVGKPVGKLMSRVYEGFLSNVATEILPAAYFFNPSAMVFYEMEVSIPSDFENYLEYRYGKDWRVPRKEWIAARDDGAFLTALQKNN